MSIFTNVTIEKPNHHSNMFIWHHWEEMWKFDRMEKTQEYRCHKWPQIYMFSLLFVSCNHNPPISCFIQDLPVPLDFWQE